MPEGSCSSALAAADYWFANPYCSRSPMLPKLLWASEIQGIVGISKRQLEYWQSTGLIRASKKTAGSHARFSHIDLRKLLMIKALNDGGMGIVKIREVIDGIMEALETDRWRPIIEIVARRYVRAAKEISVRA